MNIPNTTPPIRFRKNGEVDMRWKGAHNKPKKDHPWKKPWATHPNSFKRMKENGFV